MPTRHSVRSPRRVGQTTVISRSLGRSPSPRTTATERQRLADASFLLSTATSEGLPLALVEAMAAGCLPIAYDVPYGPSDLIVDGRTGFLVPSGDEVALAAAIERLLSLPRRTVTRMRRAAMRAARAYSDDAVTRSWATEMRMAAHRKQVAWAAEHQAS